MLAWQAERTARQRSTGFGSGQAPVSCCMSAPVSMTPQCSTTMLLSMRKYSPADADADADVDGPAGGRDPHELTLMRSGHARAHEHLDAFCDQVVGFEFRVSECAVKRLEELADARFGGLQARESSSGCPTGRDPTRRRRGGRIGSVARTTRGDATPRSGSGCPNRGRHDRHRRWRRPDRRVRHPAPDRRRRRFRRTRIVSPGPVHGRILPSTLLLRSDERKEATDASTRTTRCAVSIRREPRVPDQSCGSVSFASSYVPVGGFGSGA